jgi:hypothetical protein
MLETCDNSTYFHCLVLDIFRPLLRVVPPLQLLSFESGNGKAGVHTVYKASIEQLKRIVLCYLQKCNAAPLSTLSQRALLYVLNSLITEAKESADLKRTAEWAFYFRACLHGLSKQLPCFPAVERITQGILSMSVRDRIMSASEASKILEDMRREAGITEQPDISEYTKVKASEGTVVVDLDLATVDLSAATVDVLADQFDKLMMYAGLPSMVVCTEQQANEH